MVQREADCTGMYGFMWMIRFIFAIDGIKISTPEVEKESCVVLVQPCVKNEDRHNHKIQVKTEILDGEGKAVTEETSDAFLYGGKELELYQRITPFEPQALGLRGSISVYLPADSLCR